jgi:hypothetical protein
MNTSQKFQRAIATFFLLIFFPTLVPTSLYANTNGPTAPEANSFEPIDATDMVNLSTGDLSYVMPLLDVPSPEGGYPLTLSYHAGIAIDQDASWAGLGWTINPGAVNRSVSSFPDDWSEGRLLSMVYDAGGTISNHDFGIGVGWGNGKFSAGLYGSYTENKAFGGQNSYDFNMGVYAGIDNVQGRLGTDGVGLRLSNDFKFQAGANQSISGNYSIGIHQSFKDGSTSLSLSASGDVKNTATGTSTGSSAKTSFNGSVSIGLSSNSGSDRGSHDAKISGGQVGDSFSFSGSVGIVSINYSFHKMRYWYFDTKFYSGVGTLYANKISGVRNNSLIKTKNGFDTYTASYDQTEDSLFRNNIILPAYDFYSVSAQGIAGDISPKLFEYGTLTPKRTVLGRNGVALTIKSSDKNNFTRGLDNKNVHFYFNNVYESYLNVDAGTWGTTPSSVNSITDINSPSSSLTSSVTIDGVNHNNYDAIQNRKKGASYIETFTNQDIISNPGVVYSPANFNRNNSSVAKDGIGAFKITASDGKTYHYSLPVYQKEKFSMSSQYDENINDKFYQEFQTKPFATHWLLTAITGSDYVDSGDGTISNDDFGYWVVFDYGKWSDGYTWRTPRGGDYRTTPTSKVYEWGVKEIYYLNAIKTRTHTALFVKSERQDGKSIPDALDKEFEKRAVTINDANYDANTNQYYVNTLGPTTHGFSFYPAAGSYISHKIRMNYSKVQQISVILIRMNLLQVQNFRCI